MAALCLRLGALAAIVLFGLGTSDRLAAQESAAMPGPNHIPGYHCEDVSNCGAASQEDRCYFAAAPGARCWRYCDGTSRLRMCVRPGISCKRTGLPLCGAMWSGICLDHDNNPATPLRCSGTEPEGTPCTVPGC